jgi:hypothetical protein
MPLREKWEFVTYIQVPAFIISEQLIIQIVVENCLSLLVETEIQDQRY